MKQLTELESKVTQIVNENKNLRKQVSELNAEMYKLKEQNEQFQASFLKKSDAARTLEKEKDTVKESIEVLLESLSSLESTR